MTNPLSNLLPSFFYFTELNCFQFVFLIGLLIFLGSIGGRLFQKLKIPQVVGYIIIGIILGASGFKILSDDLIKTLNPVSTIALSLIGLLVGAELKIDVLKKYGKQFIGILLGETIVPFVIVTILVTVTTFFFTKNIFIAFSLGLILGAICTATAPAATTDVLQEYRTKGPLTTTTLGIVAMDDAFALIMYTIASAIASPLLEGKTIPLFAQLGSILYEILGSIIIGLIIGFILSKIIKTITNDNSRILGFSLGILFLATGICELFQINLGNICLGLDHILTSMTIGFYITNFAHPKTKQLFKIVEAYTPPIYVLFFVTVGAKLNIWNLKPLFILIAILYVIGRTLGKTIGAKLGAKITKAPETVRKFLPFCLLSQAGVAIGLSTAAGNDFSNTIGSEIMLIITATTFIVQVIGPICVKYGVTKAGEVGLNITADDIMKKSKVQDVVVNNHKICSKDSYTIVKDTEFIKNIIDSFSVHENSNYCVKNSEGKLCGQISLEHLKETIHIGELADSLLAMDIMDKPIVCCTPETPLPEAYRLFSDYDTDAISIVDSEKNALGILEKFTVEHYLHKEFLELKHKLAKMG